ncbi:hypothetical protein P3342_013103 [Pyrenophora teres f. teres]|nr:hypothetical protein P3342_013103 [Pyrenophora teres f. teres]
MSDDRVPYYPLRPQSPPRVNEETVQPTPPPPQSQPGPPYPSGGKICNHGPGECRAFYGLNASGRFDNDVYEAFYVNSITDHPVFRHLQLPQPQQQPQERGTIESAGEMDDVVGYGETQETDGGPVSPIDSPLADSHAEGSMEAEWGGYAEAEAEWTPTGYFRAGYLYPPLELERVVYPAELVEWEEDSGDWEGDGVGGWEPRGRDDWECDFCGPECFCWTVSGVDDEWRCW